MPVLGAVYITGKYISRDLIYHARDLCGLPYMVHYPIYTIYRTNEHVACGRYHIHPDLQPTATPNTYSSHLSQLQLHLFLFHRARHLDATETRGDAARSRSRTQQ